MYSQMISLDQWNIEGADWTAAPSRNKKNVEKHFVRQWLQKYVCPGGITVKKLCNNLENTVGL